jgi:hypothetical protein
MCGVIYSICLRNTQTQKIVDNGYVPVTNAYISININWLYAIY